VNVVTLKRNTSRVYTQIQTNTEKYIEKHTEKQTQTHTHIQTQIHTNTSTHKHINTQTHIHHFLLEEKKIISTGPSTSN